MVYDLFSILSDLITTCMYLLLRCLLLNRYVNLFSDYVFSIDPKDAYLDVPIVKHHHQFSNLLGRINLISGRFCHLGLLPFLGFSLPLLNPYCSFAIKRVFILLFTCMISLSWFAPSM